MALVQLSEHHGDQLVIGLVFMAMFVGLKMINTSIQN